MLESVAYLLKQQTPWYINFCGILTHLQLNPKLPSHHRSSVAKQVLQHQKGAVSAIRRSSGEGGVHLLPMGKDAGPGMGLLESGLAILLAHPWETSCWAALPNMENRIRWWRPLPVPSPPGPTVALPRPIPPSPHPPHAPKELITTSSNAYHWVATYHWAPTCPSPVTGVSPYTSTRGKLYHFMACLLCTPPYGTVATPAPVVRMYRWRWSQ